MNSIMHICFVCEEYPPAPHGGTGSSYRDLAEGLVVAGHRVTVVGVYPRKRLKDEREVVETISGVRVVRLPATSWMRYKISALWNRHKLSARLAREHARDPFDVIEGSDYAGWLRYGGPRGVPIVVRIRGSNLFFDSELRRAGCAFEHRLERGALARATHIASVSHYAAGRTLGYCGLPHAECLVIPNAVDTDVFAPGDNTAPEPGLIVFVNSINPKKGIEQLVDAMNLVCAEHPQARLVAIGQDTQPASDGRSYVARLLERVKPEFRARVSFPGRMPREAGVLEHLRRAQVCCYPSHMETFGIAVLEAMSVGRPVIYSRTGPGPELIEDGVSGLLCDPHSAEDIAAKISTLLCDPTRAAELGRNARVRVLRDFDKRDWVRRNVEFYQRIRA